MECKVRWDRAIGLYLYGCKDRHAIDVDLGEDEGAAAVWCLTFTGTRSGWFQESLLIMICDNMFLHFDTSRNEKVSRVQGCDYQSLNSSTVGHYAHNATWPCYLNELYDTVSELLCNSEVRNRIGCLADTERLDVSFWKVDVETTEARSVISGKYSNKQGSNGDRKGNGMTYFLMPTQKHAHCLSTSFSCASSVDLGEPGRLWLDGLGGDI
jgi:hypothetical protein